ncbi:MAG TPA: 16S rRNA (cytosine(1402)-N(4))-methyltransferase, partial [Elusimicrobia bacterium]|nr:16S rRNA (cytosine(1402)-N(4))-methyltransferase [Elusimicrobiota bacterium]
MTEQLWTHIPIMAAQIADYLLTNFEGTYIDGTLGLGGHTKYFLSHLGARACVLGFDKDEEALKMAQERVNDPRLKAFHKS